MSKINSNTLKTVTDLLKVSDDLSISSISPFMTTVGLVNSLHDIKRFCEKNRSKDITVVVMSR